jgi:hypothetical protein
MVFSHFEVLHILIRSEFHLQLPLNIIYKFGNKLRTYRLFKNNISLEPYLSMKNDEQRILLSKLRISNHNLEIERGRHRGLQS